jgi:hypothetical protein
MTSDLTSDLLMVGLMFLWGLIFVGFIAFFARLAR